MVDLKRGEIVLVNFDPTKGDEHKVGADILKPRPAVVLTRNSVNRIRRTVIVVPLSSSPKPAEIFAVPMPSAGPDSVAVCDQITAIDKTTRVLKRLGSLSSQDLRQLEQGVRDALAL
jgi:mRNA interferase MazF